MRELRETFNKRWSSFKQLYKDDVLVIYSLSNGAFEVFKYKVKAPNKIINDLYEVYPSSEDFGAWAWSCSNIKSVEKVLNNHFNGYGNKEKVLEILDSLGS